jgi:hypothetical protein
MRAEPEPQPLRHLDTQVPAVFFDIRLLTVDHIPFAIAGVQSWSALSICGIVAVL